MLHTKNMILRRRRKKYPPLSDMSSLLQQLAALLIARQVIGNIKESALPYLLEQLRLAKMSFDMFGALSPSEEAKKDLGDPPPEATGDANEEDGGEKKQVTNRNVSQAELETALYKVRIFLIIIKVQV